MNKKEKTMDKKKKTLIIVLSIITILLITAVIFYIKSLYPSPEKKGSGNVKISCVGDSITYGLGVVYNKDLAWPSLLPGKLNNEFETTNYGLSGRTLLSTGDMPYMNEEVANEFWNDREDIIIFMLGTNDSKVSNWNEELFEKEYRETVLKLQSKQGNPLVYVMIPPKLFYDTNNPERKNLEEGVIPAIKRAVDGIDNIVIIDLYELTKDHKEWFDDGIHPNKEGNEAIANAIAIIIKKTYKANN